jgi:hypothetical protein
MGWFDLYRLWQPHSQEYMFVWNWAAAKITIEQLSPATVEKVRDHYNSILTVNKFTAIP